VFKNIAYFFKRLIEESKYKNGFPWHEFPLPHAGEGITLTLSP